MKNLSIGFKIAVGFAVILIMFIIVSIISIQNTKQLYDETKRIKHSNKVLTKIEIVLGHIKDAETGQRGYIITGFENYLEPYNRAHEALLDEINELKTLTDDNDNQQLRIIKLNELIEEKINELEQTINLRRNSGFEAARKVVISDLGKQIMDNIREILSEMATEEKNLLKERDGMGKKFADSSNATIIWITIISCFIVVLLIIYYTRTIIFPIRKLSIIAKGIALGDLTEEISIVNRKDEIGVLIKGINLMSDKLFKEISEINDGVNVLTSYTSSIMDSISQLAGGASETATSVSETTSTMAEIKQTAEVSNQKATQVSENAQRTTKVSHEGTKSIMETIEGMNRIKEQMESIAAIVVRLSEQSQSIGEIAGSVNDLAEQSNLLAVNASIEAAKAGEHGKGFAVVAQEIKNLAERSKESTTQIRSILTDIQKAISSAVMATEQGGKAVDEGLELSSIANEVIRSLASSIDEAVQTSIQIAASSQQQVLGMDQITIAMENIKESSIQTADSIKETEESINESYKLGDKLKKVLEQYKLQDK